MTDETVDQGEATLFPKTVGERLREAREAQNLDLADIAQRTRIPLRHLEGIEAGDYSQMPTPTYAVGFARAYARTVGLDEVEIAREVRGRSEAAVAQRPEYQPYDVEEAPRTPSGGVMIGAAVLAAILAIGALIWFGTNWLRGDGSPSEPAPAQTFAPEPTPTPAASATPAADGQVTLVANDEVWVRIYDATNETLKMGTMAPGERFDVPPGANGPMINIGRPDKLQVLVNGTAVAPLGSGRVAIKDVPISAAALAARNLPAPSASGTPDASSAPTAAATTAPAARSTPRTRPSPSRSVPPFFRDPATTPATGTQPAPPPAAAPSPAAATGNGF